MRAIEGATIVKNRSGKVSGRRKRQNKSREWTMSQRGKKTWRHPEEKKVELRAHPGRTLGVQKRPVELWRIERQRALWVSM